MYMCIYIFDQLNFICFWFNSNQKIIAIKFSTTLYYCRGEKRAFKKGYSRKSFVIVLVIK